MDNELPDSYRERYTRYNRTDKGMERRERYDNTAAALERRRRYMREYMRSYRQARRMGITVPELRAAQAGQDPSP